MLLTKPTHLEGRGSAAGGGARLSRVDVTGGGMDEGPLTSIFSHPQCSACTSWALSVISRPNPPQRFVSSTPTKSLRPNRQSVLSDSPVINELVVLVCPCSRCRLSDVIRGPSVYVA